MVSITPVTPVRTLPRNIYAQKKVSNNLTFKGIPLPNTKVNSIYDAFSIWHKLSEYQYLEIGSNALFSLTGEEIQKHNFSFLDKIKSKTDKELFVGYFKHFTGFPNLKKVSKNIINHFNKLTDAAQKDIQSQIYENNDLTKAMAHASEIVIRGYSPISSAALGKALPGSNLDGAFLVFRGTTNSDINNHIRTLYRNWLYKNIDSRILSFAHYDSHPRIFSTLEIIEGAKAMDKYAEDFLSEYSTVLNQMLLAQRYKYGLYNISSPLNNPSRFNVALANTIQDKDERVFAKELAITIEGIRDGIFTKENQTSSQFINVNLAESTFAKFTNSEQTNILSLGIGYNFPYKNKLIQRNLLFDFDKWAIEDQYECVKNIIKNMTDDSTIDSAYEKMLTNKNCPISRATNALKYHLIFGQPFSLN